MGKVEIVLPAFNGASFIGEQIESIQRQGYTDWRLLIRDDGSGDETRSVINEYMATDERISLLEAERKHLGVVQNVAFLLGSTRADYVMLCDQDDIWLPDKIERSLGLMAGMEAGSPDLPLLVHTDLTVVDHALGIISSSFWQHQRLDPENASQMNRLLVQNVVCGCTMLMNRRLVELSLPVPDDVLMHDWWIALLACAFGRTESLREPTVLYRQHKANKIGGKGYNLARVHQRLQSPGEVRSDFLATISQARAFLQLHGPKMDPHTQALVERFATILDRPRIFRLIDMFHYHFLKTGFLRSLDLAWMLLRGG